MGVTITPDNFANFATTTIAGGAGGAGTTLNSGDTSLLVATGTGALFPSVYPYYLVIAPGAAAPEIVKVTAKSSDTLTIVRAQEGTSAATWADGTVVSNVITALAMSDLWTALSNINLTSGGTMSGRLTISASGIGVTGASSFDGGSFTTDGSGNLSAVSLVTSGSATLKGTLNWGAGMSSNYSHATWDGTNLYNVYWTPQSGSANAHLFVVWTGSAQSNLFSIGSTQGSYYIDGSGNGKVHNLTATGSASLDNTNLTTDGSGNLTAKGATIQGTVTANAPLKLATGNQDHGVWGVQGSLTGASAIASGVTFHCALTNTPSSITFTVSSSGNLGSPSIQLVNTNGFIANASGTATANGWWFGTWATVGNCIIGLDPVAGTFDHHCDALLPDGTQCGHVRRGLSVEADLILQESATGQPGLNTSPCPICGSHESFNTTFGSADETIQTLTPHGQAEVLAAQPYLIRQVMRLRGLAVQP